jgi:hypothetical protein
MTDIEFCNYMLTAAAARVLVSGEQVNRLLRLAGSNMDHTLPSGWWGTVDPSNVEWHVGRARRNAGH